MGFTDDCYTDGRDPSVLFLPTDFITVTDGMSPSVKLDNVVVFTLKFQIRSVYLDLLMTLNHITRWRLLNPDAATPRAHGRHNSCLFNHPCELLGFEYVGTNINHNPIQNKIK